MTRYDDTCRIRIWQDQECGFLQVAVEDVDCYFA